MPSNEFFTACGKWNIHTPNHTNSGDNSAGRIREVIKTSMSSSCEKSNLQTPLPLQGGYVISTSSDFCSSESCHSFFGGVLKIDGDISADCSNSAGAVTHELGESAISFDNTKAGLQQVDKTRIEAIIHEASQGSYFFMNEQRKAKLRGKKLDALLQKKNFFEANVLTSSNQMRTLGERVRALERGMEARRCLDRVFIHIDMDMFYAAVEEKKNPQLRGVPFGVGSLQMLSTTNYIARQYGVRSGMPGFIGRRLCPDLIIVPTDFASYRREAAIVHTIAARYDAQFVSLGLDELTMDVTKYLARQYPQAAGAREDIYASAEKVVAECRQAIFQATQLTASAGIAPTRTLAKIASNLNKPNGHYTLALMSRKSVMVFMRELPCRQAPGIGRSHDFLLNGLGVHTLGDIYDKRHLLFYLITPKTFEFLLASALGVSSFIGNPSDEASVGDATEDAAKGVTRKSIGQERTFHALKNSTELKQIAYHNLDKSLRRMKKDGLVCGQVVLKLKHINFQVKQHSQNVVPHTDDEAVLRHVVDELLLPVLSEFASYRLLGVRLEKLATLKKSLQPQHAERQTTLQQFLKEKEFKRRQAAGITRQGYPPSQMARHEAASSFPSFLEKSCASSCRKLGMINFLHDRAMTIEIPSSPSSCSSTMSLRSLSPGRISASACRETNELDCDSLDGGSTSVGVEEENGVVIVE